MSFSVSLRLQSQSWQGWIYQRVFLFERQHESGEWRASTSSVHQISERPKGCWRTSCVCVCVCVCAPRSICSVFFCQAWPQRRAVAIHPLQCCNTASCFSCVSMWRKNAPTEGIDRLEWSNRSNSTEARLKDFLLTFSNKGSQRELVTKTGGTRQPLPSVIARDV